MRKSLRIVATYLFFTAVAHATTTEHYPFSLPPLPYANNTLEPHIDALTMKTHHDGHHQKYVDELNKALKSAPELHNKSVEYLVKNWQQLSVPPKIKEEIRNNAGGHFNHAQFWLWMTPQATKKPLAQTAKLIDKNFKSFEQFKKEFNHAAEKVFGSGWVWLVQNPQGNLSIRTTANQDNPITDGLTPILGLDVWEHAYYLKHKNKKKDYFDAWWNVVNWKRVEDLLNKEGKA